MSTETLSVLLVDDEEAFVSLIAQQLEEQFGFRTSTLLSGTDLLQRLQQRNDLPDVIVLDHLMPECTGLNVLQWMHEQKCETPVIMLTGAGSEDLAVEAMKLGAYDYLRKDQLTLRRLANVITATYERHLFRIARVLEDERSREIHLNNLATEKVRDVLNAIVPRLNDSFASLEVELSERLPRYRDILTPGEQEKFNAVLFELRKHLGVLEVGVHGLLSLYEILYAHHTHSRHIDEVGQYLVNTLQKEAIGS